MMSGVKEAEEGSGELGASGSKTDTAGEAAGEGISPSKSKASEYRKWQFQHFDERRQQLRNEFDKLAQVKSSLDNAYMDMIQEGKVLLKMQSNLQQMLFGGIGSSPSTFPGSPGVSPSDLDPSTSSSDESDTSDSGSWHSFTTASTEFSDIGGQSTNQEEKEEEQKEEMGLTP